MKKLRWQLLIVILALAAIAILLLGQQPILQQSGLVAEPAAGGQYVEALVGSPSRFNPLLDFYNPVDRDVDRLVFSSLISFDSAGNPQPDLAESWGVDVRAQVYNVTLRSNALWHDGQPVTADDVLFTIDLLRNPDMPIPADLAELWNSVEVIAFDSVNLQFRLPDSFAPFLDYLNFGILPRHILAELTPAEIVDAQFNLAPVGSGPYRFEQLIVENDQITGVVLSAFDDHYRGRPFIDQVVFRYYETSAQALQAYQSGDVLGISQISPDTLPAALAEPNLNLYTARLPEMSIVLLNLANDQVPFFRETVVRQALMHALNRQWYVSSVLDGQGVVADGPVLPGAWAYYDAVQRYAYDPDEAISILRSAGYIVSSESSGARAKEGTSLQFDLAYPDDPTHTALALAIQRDWARVGVQANLVPVTYAALLSDYLEIRRYEAALVDLDFSRSPDPDPYPFWHQAEATGGQNYSGWDDRRASEYLERARVTPVHDERLRLYRNFQVHFSREIPALPLFYPVYSYAVDAQVQGISIGPLFDPSDRLARLFEWFLVARGVVGALPSPTP